MSEWKASDYHAQSCLQEALAEQHLAWITFEGWERVLDLGCGDGKVTARIAERLPTGSVVGVDPSTNMVAFAREHYGPPKWPNLSFEEGDARTLRFDAEFDRVVSFNALHWVPEGEAALRSIRRALKPAGQALLEFVPKGDGNRIEQVIERVRRSPRWAGYFTDFRDPYGYFSAEEYGEMAKRVGLEVLRIETEEVHWDFGTPEAFLGFVRTTSFPWTNELPESERPAFLDESLSRYAGLHGGDRVFHFFQMEVVLRRA